MDDPAGLLALPPGFRYAVVTHAGETQLNDGQGPTPSNHDGTAVFKAQGNRLRLIQNHELNVGSALGVPHVAGTVYDEGALGAGGCTVIETDNAGANYGEWVGISGTLVNCAGGPTPWGTWLTCEETETKKGGALLQDHGYVFEVFADGTSLPSRSRRSAATPTRRWPSTGPALTSTCRRTPAPPTACSTGGPHPPVRLQAGIADQLGATDGTLAAMAILMDDGSVLPDVAYITSAQLGRPFPVRWVEVPERDGQTTSVRKQFADGQVTRGKKFEGVWGTDDGVYVVNSFAFNSADLPADAAKHDGMVWFYSYADETITLVTYSPPADRGRRHQGQVRRPHLRRTRQRHRHPLGHPGARRGRRGRLARAELGAGRPSYAIARNRAQRLGVHRPDVLRRRPHALHERRDARASPWRSPGPGGGRCLSSKP